MRGVSQRVLVSDALAELVTQYARDLDTLDAHRVHNAGGVSLSYAARAALVEGLAYGDAFPSLSAEDDAPLARELNIVAPAWLVARVDAYAEPRDLTRAAAIRALLILGASC